MAVRLLAYTRWGEFVRELTDVESVMHDQEINAEDTLTVTAPVLLAKGDRLLWLDGSTWREHVVNEVDQAHSDGETFDYVCEPSIMDLRLAHIGSMSATDVTAEFALSAILANTTWEVGEVADLGTASYELEKVSAYEALFDIAAAFGGEIRATIETDEGGVTARKVDLLARIGEDGGARFEYGHNMSGVTRKVLSDDVITACYGYGANLDSEDGEETAQLTFADINGGLPYVADSDALLLWGLPDGNGGAMHSFGYYENTDCEDAQQLLIETTAYLAQHSTPAVSYETEIHFDQLDGVGLGDTVQVVDRTFTPELRLEARIAALKRDLISGETSSASFGTVVSILPDVYTRMFATAKNVEHAVTSVTPAAIMTGMNTIYENGGSNVHQAGGRGIITASVPMDRYGRPSAPVDGMEARRMSNGKFYTASSVDDNNDWQWEEVAVLTVKDGSLYWGDTKIS